MSDRTDTVCNLNAMTDGISNFDVVTGVHVQRIHPQVLVEPANSPATFPQPLPDTQTLVAHVMHQGIALAITVGIRLQTPPSIPDTQD